jgi:hypothetical protein
MSSIFGSIQKSKNKSNKDSCYTYNNSEYSSGGWPVTEEMKEERRTFICWKWAQTNLSGIDSRGYEFDSVGEWHCV